jgi:hypothetical protein
LRRAVQADGTPAQGVLIITWPAFVTSNGTEVASGQLNTTLGTNGALSVELTVNAGANPAGAYYSVVYPARAGECEDRILGGTNKLSGNAGAGANDTGGGNRGSACLHAVCRFGFGGQGE